MKSGAAARSGRLSATRGRRPARPARLCCQRLIRSPPGQSNYMGEFGQTPSSGRVSPVCGRCSRGRRLGSRDRGANGGLTAGHAGVRTGARRPLHRQCALSPRQLVPGARPSRRLDHAMIFVLIAGTYTPFASLHFGAGRDGTPDRHLDRGSRKCDPAIGDAGCPTMADGAQCVAIGWIAVVAVPELLHAAGAVALVLLAGGGVYTRSERSPTRHAARPRANRLWLSRGVPRPRHRSCAPALCGYRRLGSSTRLTTSDCNGARSYRCGRECRGVRQPRWWPDSENSDGDHPDIRESADGAA